MRKMGISGLILVCLLATVPVMAVEGGQAGSWWDGVVEWFQGFAGWVKSAGGGDLEPNGLSTGAPEAGGSLEPNGLGDGDPEIGGDLEPNG